MTKVETTTYPSKPRFLCDCDDVVVDYVQGFTSAVIATGVRDIKHGHVFTEWDLSKSLNLTQKEEDTVYSLINLPRFAQYLNPRPGAVAGIKEIMKLCDVYWVTSPLRSSQTWAFDRQAWLDKHIGEGQRVVSTHDKFLVDGDYFLDDKPDHVKSWLEAHPMKLSMMWSTGRNVTQLPEGVALVGNWQVVVDLIKLTANTLARSV